MKNVCSSVWTYSTSLLGRNLKKTIKNNIALVVGFTLYTRNSFLQNYIEWTIVLIIVSLNIITKYYKFLETYGKAKLQSSSFIEFGPTTLSCKSFRIVIPCLKNDTPLIKIQVSWFPQYSVSLRPVSYTHLTLPTKA